MFFQSALGLRPGLFGVSVQAKLDGVTSQLAEKTGYGVISGLVVAAQSTPDMTVKVSAGVAYMPNGTRYAPAAVASLAVTAADATNPRIDIVYLSSAGVVSYLAGTAAATPEAPATPTGGLLLAEISVAANQTTVAAANIALRKKNLWTEDWIMATLVNGASGGVFPARYAKGADGIVRFTGRVVVENASQECIPIPAGYRPGVTIYFGVPLSTDATTIRRCDIGASGVKLYATGTYDLSGISYRAEA